MTLCNVLTIFTARNKHFEPLFCKISVSEDTFDMKESEAMLLRIVYLMNRSTKLTENVTVQGLM